MDEVPVWRNSLLFGHTRSSDVWKIMVLFSIALREAILSSIIYHPVSRRRAVVPKHNRDMPKGTLLSLLREAGFTREEMIAFLAD